MMRKTAGKFRWPWVFLIALSAVSTIMQAGQRILDQTVAVVGERAITASEVEEQIALEYLDREQPTERSAERYREVVERLIRLRLVQHEMDLAGFVGATDAQVRQQMDFMRRQSGGAARLQQALADYGLSETILENFIRQQLDFQLFVGFRFRTGLVIPREEVEAYYATEFRSQLPAFSSPPPLERVYEDLEAELVERRVDPLLNDWINRVRSQTRIMIVERSAASAVTESP